MTKKSASSSASSAVGSGSSWVMTAIMVAILGSALAAHFGFQGRVTTIGVDLGTTFSVVGLSRNGKVEIVTDKDGHRIFPSVISYQPGGEILSAYAALKRLSDDPLNTIFNSKRFIGRNLDDEQVDLYGKAHPFKVTRINDTISAFGKVGFELSSSATGHVSPIAPESVGARVLTHLLAVTAEYLGHKEVNKAIITVPAKFTAEQRQATGAAYKAAGLKVIRVIEEPTAAAVAYQLHKKSNIQHILVYDFGGGTLDVSILYVHKGSVQVYATDGDETLGGSDFDLCLTKYLSNKVQVNAGRDIVQSGEVLEGDGMKSEECTLPSIRVMAEEIKKDLSSREVSEFSCKMPDTNVSFDVTREEFQSVCLPLFERGMLPVTRLLEELEMDKEDIDEIVLVGGTTRVPYVKQQLKKYFGKDLNDHIDPDVTVAYGAASIMD